MINAVSGNPVPNLKVVANRKLAPDQLQWAAERITDASGKAVFDLDGLGTGATFVLSAAPYNGGTVYSDELRQGGSYDFRVGSVELTVLNPSTGAPASGVKVDALVKNADGTLTWVKQGVSDAQGLIRFDLPGLGSGRVYVFEAKSLSDGSSKRSQEINQLGKYVFKVGNAPLLVTVQNGVSGTALAGLPVTASEKLATELISRRTTPTPGKAVFDSTAAPPPTCHRDAVQQPRRPATISQAGRTLPRRHTEVHAVNGATGAVLAAPVTANRSCRRTKYAAGAPSMRRDHPLRSARLRSGNATWRRRVRRWHHQAQRHADRGGGVHLRRRQCPVARDVDQWRDRRGAAARAHHRR